jgi:hypothetical protein
MELGRTIDHHHAGAAAPGERSELRGHRQRAASKDQQCRGVARPSSLSIGARADAATSIISRATRSGRRNFFLAEISL